jgi:carbonic anhydrase/acetyltransferase-like protein (isoleucine patch superfamily)
MPVIVPFGGHTPNIHPTAWVAPNATLIGDVTIEAGASVFFGAVIRADGDGIRIGKDSNVQDNVTMHTDAGLPLSVGSRVSIGHGAILHGCTVGDDCLIGMGATMLNGSEVGAGSLVAAHSLVLENSSLPAASLAVGTPAKAVRSLSAEEQIGLVQNARHYVELSQKYRAGGI